MVNTSRDRIWWGWLTGVIALLVMAAPVSAEDLKPEVQSALDAGDTAQAVSLLEREIELDEGYHFNYYVLGKIYYDQGHLERARKRLETAIDKKSKHWPSVYLLGRVYIEQERFDDALKLMKRGRNKAKDDERAMFENGYGLVMLARGNYQEADRAFRQALVLDSLNAEYHINLGDANFYQGIPSLAIMEYEEALKLDTASLEVYYHWAEACLEMKDYSCAIDNLKLVLQKDSTHARSWMRAGEIYFKAALSTRTRNERNARFKDAIGSYKKYFELTNAAPDSSNVRANFEIAMSYVNLYGFEDAAMYFDKVLSIPYEPRDIYFYYGKALWGMRDFMKAGEMLEKHVAWAEQQDEDYRSTVRDKELYQLLGDCYFYRKPPEFFTAIEYYKRTLEEDPEQKRVLQNVALGYHQLGSHAQALEYYDKRIELGIDSSEVAILKNAGSAALTLANAGDEGAGGFGGDDLDIDALDMDMPQVQPASAGDPNIDYYAKAVGYYDQYLDVDPKDLRILELAANTRLYQMSDCTEGVAYYERILALDPQNCQAMKSIGYAYFGDGICTKNYGTALKHFERAHNCFVETKGNCGDPALMLWIAQAYHLRAADKSAGKQDASSDFENANIWYKKVLKCEPNNQEAIKGRDDTEYEF